MNSDAYRDIEKLETDLWEAADNLRANSKLTSSDYRLAAARTTQASSRRFRSKAHPLLATS